MGLNRNLGNIPQVITELNGNIGIGTTSPTELLEVVKNQNATTRLLVSNSDTTNSTSRASIRTVSGSIIGEMVSINGANVYLGTASNHDLSLMSNGSERMRITTSGTTLFRRQTTLDPNYAAGFEGAIFFKTAANGNNTVNFFNASTTYVASIVTNASSIVYWTGSDYRLKEDLKDFNGLEKISKIKVYDFKFIKEGDRMDGVLAHELQEVVPYAVTGEKDELDDKGNIKIQNVDYSKLTPILIKAIQEQQETIKQLTNRIINLENK